MSIGQIRAFSALGRFEKKNAELERIIAYRAGEKDVRAHTIRLVEEMQSVLTGRPYDEMRVQDKILEAEAEAYWAAKFGGGGAQHAGKTNATRRPNRG